MSKRKATASHSAQGHYHGPITRGTITDNLSCCRCSSSIDIVADHVVLSPCHCCVCPECLLEVLAEKGAGKVDCPSCGTPVSSHHFYKGRLPRREIVRHSESAAPRMTKAELLKKHPFTALSLLNQDLIRSSSAKNVDCEITVLYSASYRRKKDEGWKLTYCAELLTNVGDSLPDPEYCQSAMNFGKFLSRHFVLCSIVPYRNRISFSTPVEYLHHNADQPTPLLSFLFGLATGENRIDKGTVKQPMSETAIRLLARRQKRGISGINSLPLLLLQTC